MSAAEGEYGNVKDLVTVYDMKPTSVKYDGHFSQPPNPQQKSPHPHKRGTLEYRPYNLINGELPGATNFLS